MMLTPDDFHIVETGNWIDALAAIRKMLDARFGSTSIQHVY
jgi:hypothetical protein